MGAPLDHYINLWFSNQKRQTRIQFSNGLSLLHRKWYLIVSFTFLQKRYKQKKMCTCNSSSPEQKNYRTVNAHIYGAQMERLWGVPLGSVLMIFEESFMVHKWSAFWEYTVHKWSVLRSSFGKHYYGAQIRLFSGSTLMVHENASLHFLLYKVSSRSPPTHTHRC